MILRSLLIVATPYASAMCCDALVAAHTMFHLQVQLTHYLSSISAAHTLCGTVTRTNEWCDMYKCANSHVSLKLYVSFVKEPYKRDYILQKRPIMVWHVWMRQLVWHVWMHHVTFMDESYYMYEWVKLYMGMSYVTCMDESCRIYKSATHCSAHTATHHDTTCNTHCNSYAHIQICM